MKLTAIVHEDRRYLGKLRAEDDGETYEFRLSAMADPDSPATDPQTGTYSMTRIMAVPASNEGAVSAYGGSIVYFQSKSGDKIAIHGGDTDDDGHLLPTEGTLRIDDEDLATLIGLLRGKKKVTLEIRQEDIGFLDHLPSHKVSKRPLNITPPPYDRTSDGLFTDPFFWLWLLSDEGNVDHLYDSQGDFNIGNEPPMEGKGGEFLGAAATGQWDEQGSQTAPDSADTQADKPDLDKTPPIIVDPFADDQASTEGTGTPGSHDAPSDEQGDTATEEETSQDTEQPESDAGGTSY